MVVRTATEQKVGICVASYADVPHHAIAGLSHRLLATHPGAGLTQPLAGSHLLSLLSFSFRFIDYNTTDMVTYTHPKPKRIRPKQSFIGINVRLTMKQKAQLITLAAKCGMSEGEYVRSCCLGHHPRARLCPYEIELLQSFSACRSDIVNFSNAMKKLSPAEKESLFHTQSKMLTWLRAIAIVAQACKVYITEVTSSDRMAMERNATVDEPDGDIIDDFDFSLLPPLSFELNS